MHPAVKSSARGLTAKLAVASPRNGKDAVPFVRMSFVSQSLWTCAECRFKLQTRAVQTRRTTSSVLQQRRHISSSIRRLNDNEPPTEKPISPTQTASTSRQADTVAETLKSLPSHAEKRRWQFSRDMTKFVDRLLARASIAGQHINVYTGTDYTGIETLRKEIIAQEQKVRDSHRAAEDKKTEHHDAVAKQAASQKEIVSLLERKSSWSPADLERYMSLVRFEHTDEQSVQAAKEGLVSAERELEDARSLLEKLERKQYHEEQVWSDTIRRNSTWVTFGLMGVNIILLLAQILVFEPYRRRKIVRDVKTALDDRTLHALPPAVEKQVDNSPVIAEATIEAIQEQAESQVLEKPAQHLDLPFPVDEEVIKEAVVIPQEETPVTQEVAPAVVVEQFNAAPESAWEAWQARVQDLFSERIVQIKQVEVTTIALQGVATGVAAMGMLFVLLRPR